MNENKSFDYLVEKLKQQYGKEETNKIIEGMEQLRKTTLRINSIKSNKSEVCEELESNEIKYLQVSWYDDALIIENASENEIRNLEIYKEGKIYLQSLSSMIPPLVLNPKEGENILDMAAAPGGKTTQLYNLSNGKASITACEKNKIRAERLKYNIEKQDAGRVGVLTQDARKLDKFFMFDTILLDAPCSGSGTLHIENSKICEEFSEELVKRSAKVQKELINEALKHIKVGKSIVYSTCSILEEENEEYIIELIGKGTIEVVPIEQNILEEVPILPTKIEGALCVCPTELFEGFFVVKLRRIK